MFAYYLLSIKSNKSRRHVWLEDYWSRSEAGEGQGLHTVATEFPSMGRSGSLEDENDGNLE